MSKHDKEGLTGAIDNLRKSTEELLEKQGINYNNALLVNEISRALSQQFDIDGILTEVIKSLEQST